jgi:proteasome maturation protein
MSLTCVYVTEHDARQWQETQDNLKLTMQRNIYGVHAPIRLLMERKIVSRVCSYFCMLSKDAHVRSESPHARNASVEPALGHPHGP